MKDALKPESEPRTGLWRAFAGSYGLAAILVCSACSAPSSEREDYLSPELRARVERLKEEVEAQPTSESNFVERSQVFFQWSNAFSLTGGAVPADGPTTVMRLIRDATMGVAPPARMLAGFDGMIRELRVKDEDPGAIGSLRFASAEPLVADSYNTIEQTYTVGTKPLEVGAVILLGGQIMADQGDLQHEDPAGDGYVSLRVSDPEVSFEKFTISRSGRHGGFKDAKPMPSFRLLSGSLEEGESFTVTYGDREGGSAGLRLQTLTTDNLLLPIYLDFDGEGHFYSAAWPGLEVVGRDEVRSVVAFAPSVVAVDEPFELVVRSEDRYTNRSSGATPAYEVLLGEEVVATVQAGEEPIAVLADLRISTPGPHRFEVRSADGDLEAVSNPIWVSEDPPYRVYWGETHGHSGYAEGQGSAQQFFTYARDDARLDFVSLTDHDSSMDDREWRMFQELSRSFTEEGRFVAYLGYEWSATRDLGGHHNVFFRTPDHDRVPNQEAPTLPDLYEGLRRENASEDVLIIPHAHQAGDWNQGDGDLEKLVEIASMHGTFEWFGNRYLLNGFEIGFISASDDHRSKPGYAPGMFFSPQVQGGGLAAVMAPAKTTDGIFDGLRSLRAYATSGERIVVDATLNGEPMGTRLEASDRREIACQVLGTAPIDRVDVVRNAEVILSRSYMSAPLSDHAFVQVGFESSSEVFGPDRDNPRVYRVWTGTLRVEGAKVLDLQTPGLKNRYLEWARVEPEGSNEIRFYVETRGRMHTLLVELEGSSADTAFIFDFEAARENGFAPPLVREPVDIPAAHVELRLRDLDDSRVEQVLPVGRHQDRVALQIVDPEAPWHQSFDFVDMEPGAPGDYYYVRVSQLDGGRAWSSPFWVGRRPTGAMATGGAR